MEKQVGDDLINALRLFSYRFGTRPVNTLSASELSAWHGQSFPGFLHLGAFTWMRTDRYGNQRNFRAHEVAHQWWGTGVRYETYHDQWLSEGFATYSALMYVQTVEGNDRFIEKLEKYRKDIFTARKFLVGSAEENGPIALGYRTQSSKSADNAYSLIIYRKGAIVLHMLRNLFLDLNSMNEDAFFDMMKEWYATYRGKDATTADFKRLTEKYVGVDMSWFFNQWVYGTDLPTYTFSYEIQPDANNTFKAVCTVLSEGVDSSFITDVPVQIQMSKDRSAYIRVAVSGQKTEFTIPGLTEKPQKITFNVFESILAEVKQ
jgi:aminopeptidase N